MQQPITNPPVPFLGPIPGGFAPGTMVRIQGQVPPTADRFNVNLNCGPPPSDTALHLSVRLLQNYVARNSLEGGNWGSEEDSGDLPIAPGQRFEVLILCDPGSYKVAINGNHFCEFRHRIPFQKVTDLAIDGDVALGLIAFEGGASAPPPSMGGGPDFSQGYGPPPGQYGPPPGQYGPSPAGGAYPGYGPPRPSRKPKHGAMTVPLANQPPPMGMPMPSAVPLPPPYMSHGPPPYMSHGPPPYMPSLPTGQPLHPQVPPYRPPPTYIPPPMPGYPVPGQRLPGYPASGQPLPPYGPQAVYPHKKMKKSKLKKAMKYGLPIAGVGVGAYALGHAMHSSSSSSSSSDSD